jgi:ABC-type phosphate/phosphonate transport system substrate-binding protein
VFKLGAVAYDAKVVPIWEGFKKYFEANGFDFDFVLYSNYEAQVEAHLAGHFDVAWNSPLAWIETRRAPQLKDCPPSAIAMRDTDQDLTSVIVVLKDSPVESVDDLRGRTVAVGAEDSPQATMIPLLHIAESGLEPETDFTIQLHDTLRGKHGDHIGGERDAARSLVNGSADAACMIDGNHLLFSQEGTLPASGTRILERTGRYDHCNFTVLDDSDSNRPAIQRFTELLLAMRYDDPDMRGLLDMEGLKEWKPGRTSGYELLDRATTRFGTIDAWLERNS